MSDAKSQFLKARKKAGMTQEDFAFHVTTLVKGVQKDFRPLTKQAVSAWERGVAFPGKEAFEAVCALSGMEPNEFFSVPSVIKKLTRSSSART